MAWPLAASAYRIYPHSRFWHTAAWCSVGLKLYLHPFLKYIVIGIIYQIAKN